MDDLRPRLEAALADTYIFERELGGGGMSRTYLAREKALDRRVVVKVLAPELLAGISVERFRREVLLAAQLQHPHVVPVLTAGDVDGLPWFSMPYVDGDSLRQRLARGPVGIGEAVGILRDVARALAFAHGHGIVHRDIKPDNVLLSAGSATVTDFGIAKAINAARGGLAAPNATLTVAGTSIGTPTYMAPEQAAGDPRTDHRADLYSFGALAYELLAGQPPFHGYHPAALLAAHLSETPEDVRVHRKDCPDALAELVMRCLLKNPESRPQAATDLVRVLDSVTSSGAVTAAPSILSGRIRFGKAFALWSGATALVALVAWAATESIGLPDWVLPGSLGVMLAGLPVIVATWYVQRVVHRTYASTPQLTPGGSRPPQGTMATLAIKASPLLSWRRAWLGGGIAVGSFAALVIAFMVMRAAGIGPFGSLRGSGAFGARETIVVADFRGPASDSTLGATVAEALRTDLAQSTALRVLTRANVREILTFMRRPAESLVQFDLAREIATREGAKAVLDGEVVQLGSGYVVSARLVSALDGSELATFRETAAGEDALIGALSALSRAVRDKSGESLRAIRRSSELERVTTPSLAALRKYVDGSIIADERGETDRGLAMLQEAVTIDTAFAMAWRKIAVLLGNEGRERARAIDAVETAYRHRDRLSEMERFLLEGYYFTRGPRPDRQKALAAYEAAIERDSLNTSAINNAGTVYVQLQEDEKAEQAFRRVIALPRTFGGAFTNLLQAQIRNGRLTALDSTRDAFRARFPESGDLWEADWYVEAGHGRYDVADSVSRTMHRAARTPRQAIRTASAIGSIAELRGRPRESLRWFTISREATMRVAPGNAQRLYAALDTAYVLSGPLGRNDEALRIVTRALQRTPLSSIPEAERPLGMLLDGAAELRDVGLARTAHQEWMRIVVPTAPDSIGATAHADAHLAFAEGRWDDAIARMQESERRFAGGGPLHALVTIAQAHDLAGRPDSAIVYLERLVNTPDPNLDTRGRYGPAAHKRLGELYDARGDRAKAVEHFERFVELWKDAEPELQPMVREVRAKLERLRRGEG